MTHYIEHERPWLGIHDIKFKNICKNVGFGCTNWNGNDSKGYSSLISEEDHEQSSQPLSQGSTRSYSAVLRALTVE